MSDVPPNVQDKQSPYVGYFRGNGSRTASRLFEPNSHPHVGVYRHSPAKTTSNGLQEILRDKRTSLKPRSVISTLQLFNVGSLPKHFEKKTLELMPTSQFMSNRNLSGETSEECPMCPICLENFTDGDEIRNLKCSHCFHKTCIDIWLLGTMSCDVTTTVCPTCRQDASGAISGPDSGNCVFGAVDYPSPISSIPAECFVRVGQFLLHEGSKLNTALAQRAAHLLSPRQSAPPTPSPSLPLSPIQSSRSPPLPSLHRQPRNCHLDNNTTNNNSPSPAAFCDNVDTHSNNNGLRTMFSNSSMSSYTSCSISGDSPPPLPQGMFFSALDDTTPVYSDDNEINYYILADVEEEYLTGSFMQVDVCDDESDE